jgi:ADP-ribose pyrophosphatase YjhB (NUDIX family)
MDKREKFQYDRPVVTVGGFIVAQDGDILLVQSHKWSDTYTVPGGKVDHGETLEAAYKREVKEETNLDIHDIKFALIIESISSKEFWKKDAHFIMNDYIGTLTPECTKSDVILNDEAQSYIWCKPQEASKIRLSHETNLLLNWYLKYVTKH